MPAKIVHQRGRTQISSTSTTNNKMQGQKNTSETLIASILSGVVLGMQVFTRITKWAKTLQTKSHMKHN